MTSVQMDPRLRARRIEVMRLQGRRRLRLVSLLLVGSIAVAVGWWIATESPLLDVDQVRVEGAVRTPVDAVLDQADIERGEALVEVKLDEAELAIAGLPWIDTVQSRRGLDGVVSIDITERTPVAAVPGRAGWLLVDFDGRVLAATKEPGPGVLTIDGTRWNVEPGAWIGESALDSIELAASLPDTIRSDVESIRSEETTLDLMLRSGGRIELGGTDDLESKLVAALTVLREADTTCLDRLDVRAPSVPVLTRLANCS